jgi:flagellar assembly protein FliH
MATAERFEYPPIPNHPFPAWEGICIAFSESDQNLVPLPQPSVAPPASAISEPDREASLREVSTAIENGRTQGIEEGRMLEREAQREVRAAADRQRFRQAAALAEEFARERHAYSLRVEPEVVKLALEIAERILRREVQLDPLMLTGAVRVALGQLSNAARVRLRVPSADLTLWSEAMAHMPNLVVRPEVLAVDEMQAGDCVVEAEVGSVDLGFPAQLHEIERSFFDRSSADTRDTPGRDLQKDSQRENP